MNVSIALENYSLLWMDLFLSPMVGFFVEVSLHSDGLCTVQFPRNFTPVSLLHQFHAVSFQVLLLDSLSSVLMFFFSQVALYLESLTCVFLFLDSFPL